MTSPLRLRRDYGEDRVATGLNDDSFESLFNNPPDSISLPWGSPAKPNLWKTKRIKYPALKMLAYSIESPALSEPLTLYFTHYKTSSNVKIKLYDSEGVMLYSRGFEPSNLYTVSKTLQLFWHYLNDDDDLFKKDFITIPKIASSGEPSAYEHISTRPSSIPLPWGNPAKPNIWKAQYQGGSRYVVTSPVLSTAYTYILIVDKDIEKVSLIAFDQEGRANEVYIYPFYDMFKDFTLHGILRIFWKRMWADADRIKKYLTVPKVASPQRVPALISLSDLPNILPLPWGNPPKPNMWKTKKIGDGFYLVTSPALKPNYRYTLQLRARSFEFSALSKRVNYSIYDYEWTLDEVEQDTLEELLETFWKYMMNYSDRHGGSKGIKKYLAVPKVASSQDVPAATALNNLPEILTLPWGNPPKPNVWSTEKWFGGQYTVLSPVLDPSFGYMLNLDRNPSSRFKIVFDARLNGKKWEIHRKHFHKRELLFKSLNDILKEFWEDMWELSLKNGVLTQYLTVPKVASSSALTVEDLFNVRPDTFELAWGYPIKKNVWSVKKISQLTSYGLTLIYEVESPLLKHPIYFHMDASDNNGKITIEVREGSSWGSAYYSHSFNASDSFYSLPLDVYMRGVWNSLTHTKKLKTVLLSKVASHNPTCINDIVKHKPKTFELAWGTPVKKNLWKVSLKHSVFLPLGENKIVYTIQSPVLNPHLSIEFLVDGKKSVKTTVRVGYSGDILFSLTYSVFHFKERNQPLDIFTEMVWHYLMNNELLQKHLKPNIKVASTLSRIRDRQTYGLRSLSNPSSQTGLFFYPVRQHRSKRATRHAFYLNDTELNIMEWQGSEWSRVSSVSLRRQQSELLLRLLRTIANTIEKM
jgi:hypothetical protein